MRHDTQASAGERHAEVRSDVLRQRRAPLWVRVLFNPLAKWILRSPLHGLMSQRLLLITFTGRKTGKRFTTPISYVRDGDVLVLGVRGSWWKNLLGGVRVRVRGRNHTAVAEVVTDDAGMRRAYQTILVHNPTQARFMGIRADPDRQPRADDVRQAIQHGAAVVRIRLTD